MAVAFLWIGVLVFIADFVVVGLVGFGFGDYGWYVCLLLCYLVCGFLGGLICGWVVIW